MAHTQIAILLTFVKQIFAAPVAIHANKNGMAGHIQVLLMLLVLIVIVLIHVVGIRERVLMQIAVARVLVELIDGQRGVTAEQSDVLVV